LNKKSRLAVLLTVATLDLPGRHRTAITPDRRIVAAGVDRLELTLT
jgi:hypothetical protein